MVYNLAHRNVLARARLGRRCVERLTPIGWNRQTRIYDVVLAGSIASIWCPSSSLARGCTRIQRRSLLIRGHGKLKRFSPPKNRRSYRRLR
jgi:hypothetical protein